jgi:hypothetical protein
MNHRTLIIPCGGLGTRLSAYPFPKCLLPVAQRPILFQIMQAWRTAIDHVVLVLNPQNERLVRRYVETYWTDSLPIDFALQRQPTGTYFAVREGLKFARSPRVILNWCDLYPTSIPDDDQLSAGNLAFTSDRAEHCRWEYREGRFRRRSDRSVLRQGVLGIFAFERFESVFRDDWQPGSDGEIEILEAFDPRQIGPLTWEGFVDVGDASRYGCEIRAADDAGLRAFGSGATLEWRSDRIVKRHADASRASAETNWYAQADVDFVPRVYRTQPLTLERLDAEPCSQWLAARPTAASESTIVGGLFDLARRIHQCQPPRSACLGAVRAHYLGKTRDRLQRVRFLIDPLRAAVQSIDGVPAACPFDLLDRLELSIADIFPDQFHFIHGDLQLSNTLIDNRERFFAIDPRGSFGDGGPFGDALYDFAKIYYGFCGNYDRFSRGANSFTLAPDGGLQLEPLLPPAIVDRRRRLFAAQLHRVPYLKRSMQAVDIVHALIWLSVSDFIANDVLSSSYAYFRGAQLLCNALSTATQKNNVRFGA